jgi:hypothetical protein
MTPSGRVQLPRSRQVNLNFPGLRPEAFNCRRKPGNSTSRMSATARRSRWSRVTGVVRQEPRDAAPSGPQTTAPSRSEQSRCVPSVGRSPGLERHRRVAGADDCSGHRARRTRGLANRRAGGLPAITTTMRVPIGAIGGLRRAAARVMPSGRESRCRCITISSAATFDHADHHVQRVLSRDPSPTIDRRSLHIYRSVEIAPGLVPSPRQFDHRRRSRTRSQADTRAGALREPPPPPRDRPSPSLPAARLCPTRLTIEARSGRLDDCCAVNAAYCAWLVRGRRYRVP